MNRFLLFTRVNNRLSRSVNSIRQLQLTSVANESMLASLRKKTGLAFNLCKKALEENGNDVNKAEQWLKVEAAKHGWAKTVRLDARKASEGLIGIYIDSKGSSAVALEVNCETDFVAKNTIFRQLVSTVTRRIAEATPVHSATDFEKEAKQTNKVIGQYLIDQQQLNAFQDEVGEAVIQLGEKIRLTRALLVRGQSNDSARLVGYTHSAAGSNLVQDGVLLGKYGTIVAFKPLASSEEFQKLLDKPVEVDEEGFELDKPVPFEESTRNICQHIIGMKPKKVGQLEVQPESAESQTDKSKLDDEPETLFDQKFLLDDDKTVRDYAKFNNLNIIDFVRIECGETQSE